MEITLFRTNKRSHAVNYSCIDIYEYFEGIRTGLYQDYLQNFRDTCYGLKREDDYPYYDLMYKVIPAAKWVKKPKIGVAYVNYSGIIALKVPNVVDQITQDRIKAEAMQIPQTLAVFVGADAQSVVILAQAVLPGMSLPQQEDEAELFHAKAYRMAVMCYAPTLSRGIEVENPRLDVALLASADANICINPSPVPFIVPQPNAIEVRQLTDSRLPQNLLPEKGRKGSFLSMHQVFNGCVSRARQAMPKETWLAHPIAAVTAIAQECAECGMPEEEATQHLLWRYYKENAQDVRSTIRNIYEETDVPLGITAQMPKKQVASIRLKEFMDRRYELRRNVVTQTLEYRTRHSLDFLFHELTKYDRNTIKYEAAVEGIEAFDAEINGFIESNYTPTYNPIEDFLANLEEWDGRDRLQALCDMVPTNHPHWDRLFRRWFLSMVAHWMDVDREHGNNTAPILIGKQGYRKSTFCRILLPPELRGFFTDSVDFRTKQEAERYLTRFLLINIDEFDQLSENQFAFIKHLFQKPSVSMRRMYSETIGQQRRYASFIGTSNHQEILRDPTGNRRYLCVEVTAPIHTDTPIEYGQLYAQAVSLIRRQERYWLDDEDEALLREANAVFEVQTPQELVLLDTFRPVPETEDGAELLKLTDIMAIISQHKSFNRKTMNNLRALGRVMSRLNFAIKRKAEGTYYWVKRV